MVAIEYPRKGIWTIGFLTNLNIDEKARAMAIVYIPTAPMPNSGWVAVLTVDQVYDTDMTIQDAMQMVLSGGIVAPERISKRPLLTDEITNRDEVNANALEG